MKNLKIIQFFDILQPISSQPYTQQMYEKYVYKFYKIICSIQKETETSS